MSGRNEGTVGLPQEWIRRKRDGHELTSVELHAFVEGVTTGAVSEAQIAAFAMAVYFQDLSVQERVELTLAVRDSGRVLAWDSQSLGGPVLDKHSTGGVGDTVSLMLAPMLAACGAYVPMIAGRGLAHTGGTIDKLEAIPGYQTGVDVTQFQKVVRDCGFAIVRQTDDLAPADRRMYATRDVTATVENLGLITASIVSKKVGCGAGAPRARRQMRKWRRHAGPCSGAGAGGKHGGRGQRGWHADVCALDGHVRPSCLVCGQCGRGARSGVVPAQRRSKAPTLG